MSGRTLKRAAAIDSVVAAPPGLGRETRAGCGAAGVRQLEAPLMQSGAAGPSPPCRPGGEPQEVRARFIGDGL